MLVAWRVGSLPREPTKIRPSIVVEDDELFPDAYPNIIVVPMTRNEDLAYVAFAERIEPSAENGSETTSWALAHHVTAVSMRRVKATPSRITPEQLKGLRRRMALALGLS